MPCHAMPTSTSVRSRRHPPNVWCKQRFNFNVNGRVGGSSLTEVAKLQGKTVLDVNCCLRSCFVIYFREQE